MTPMAASASTIQTGSAGGLQYKYLIGPGGCSAANPCQVVEYLHFLGGESQVPADLKSYFDTPAFWAAHPNTIVVAPQVNGSTDDNNWGGVQYGISPNGQAAVDAVRQIEAQYHTNPNTVVLTGGSMGGIGTQALMEEFGPKGTTGQHVYAAGLAYDGAMYNTDPSSEKGSLCGVPLIVQHGTADSTVNPGPDNALAQVLSGCSGFQYVQVPNAGHGTWGSGYADGSQLSKVMALAAGGSMTTSSAGSGPTSSALSMPASQGSQVAIRQIPELPITTLAAGSNGSAAPDTARIVALPENNQNTTPQSGGQKNDTTCPSNTAITPFSLNGTRDPAWIPFSSDSVFNRPLGLNADWQQNAQLASAGVQINTEDIGYNEHIYVATAQDPVVRIQSDGSAGGGGGSFTMHMPVTAVPAKGGDQTLTIYDRSTGQWCGMGGVTIAGSGSATAREASCEAGAGSGLEADDSNWDQGVGTLRGLDLKEGTIHHMLRAEIPSNMAMSWSKTTTATLAPNAWPQTAEDGYALTGSGGVIYSGTVPYGITFGISALDQEPDNIKSDPGADMLWRALQSHGAMVRDTTNDANQGLVTFQTDQEVSGSDPLIQGMIRHGRDIMSHVMILANQGPNSVNGGGTPIVPLLPPVPGQGVVQSGNFGSKPITGCSTPGDIATNLSVDNLSYRAQQNDPGTRSPTSIAGGSPSAVGDQPQSPPSSPILPNNQQAIEYTQQADQLLQQAEGAMQQQQNAKSDPSIDDLITTATDRLKSAHILLHPGQQ